MSVQRLQGVFTALVTPFFADGGLAAEVRHALRNLDAVPVPGRGVAISYLLPLGEARVAVERLHQVAFARAPVEEPALT
jgi:hypothetical protein